MVVRHSLKVLCLRSSRSASAKAFACTYITAISTGLARIILWDAQAHNAAKTPRKPIGQNIIAL